MTSAQSGTPVSSFDIVPRQTLPVLIGTATGLEIRGIVYLIPDTRLRDLVERKGEEFIAVTNATITSGRGKARSTPFLAVNKAHVVTIEEAAPAGASGGSGIEAAAAPSTATRNDPATEGATPTSRRGNGRPLLGETERPQPVRSNGA
ncbi:MAG TPA: hypothetical protein VFC51_07790 [Chloroflexota bacterium]|nr:hypothetical protein [Chloroflexota bacterium]